jgi:TolA-binding protein
LNLNAAKSLTAIFLALFLAGPASSSAQSRQELQDYGRATNMFVNGMSSAAESALDRFVTTYTNSTLRTNAVLYLARSRIGLSNYTAALDLLQGEMANSGKLGADFVYWMAQAYYGMGQYTNVIERCAFLLQNYSSAAPPLPLRATLLQARAWAELTNWTSLISLLSQPGGVFQAAAKGGQNDPDVVGGYFLLGEACLNQKQDQAAEEILGKINTNGLGHHLQWQRQDLLCRVFLEEGRLEEALEGSTNLLAFLPLASQEQRASTWFLRGEILERTNQVTEALQAYSNNLAGAWPAEVKLRALDKTINLKLRQEPSSNTVQWLEDFIQQRTNEPALEEVAHFHLGDLKLKAYFAAPPPDTNVAPPADTNLLFSAVTNLDLVTNSSDAELLGRAALDRGWCDWARGDFAGASNHFFQAVTRLPFSESQAVALLKLGDACFRLTNYAAAVLHYDRLIHDYGATPGVTNGLFDIALYQLVQANTRLGHEEAARAAAREIFDRFPVSGFGEQSLLLLGENSPTTRTARATFEELLGKYPGTGLGPQVQLAIARTYEQEGDWTNAFNSYTNLEGSPDFATNALRPRVEFSIALDCAKAGLESNALSRMSNVVSLTNLFPGDFNEALAQNWIGNHHMNHGNYSDADYAFQELANPKYFPNAGDLAWEARLNAGRAAFNHQDLPGASNDFFLVAANTNAPAALQAEGYFQLGYTDFQLWEHNRTNENLLTAAIAALRKVADSSPSNFLATLAVGQLGNCFLEWADLNKTNVNNYTNAIPFFKTVLLDTNNLPADITARSQAEYGLGLIAERQEQTQEALRHYCNVVFDTDTEHADPYWVKEAGVKAAALCEARKDWQGAIAVYRQVQEVVPSLHDAMQKKIDQITAAGN